MPVNGGQGDAPHALCEHCGTMLDVDGLYGRCACCGRYHRNGYTPCPLCAGERAVVGRLSQGQADSTSTVTSTSTSTSTFTASDGGARPGIGGIQETEEAPPDQKQERDARYYWRLYMDYRPAPSLAGTEPVQRPAPVAANGHEQTDPAGHPARKGRAEGGADAPGVDLAVAGQGSADLFSHIVVEGSQQHMAAPPAPPQQQGDDAPSAKTSEAGNYNEFEYELIQDPSRLAEVAELLTGESVIGVDTETDGLDPYTSQLLLLQIATPDRVYIVDCRRVVPLVLKPLLENPGVLKVAQNAKFDYEMLRQQVGITLTNLFDTMLAERIMTAGIGREISLRLIAQKYLGAILDKTVRESFHASRLALRGDAYLSEEQLHYAARDAHIMIPIWRHQTRELKKLNLMQIAELEFRCIPAVGDLELAGVRIDEARWRKIIEDVAVQRDRAAAELAEMLQPASMQATMFGVSAINLNSSSQLIEAFARLGVDLPDTMEATLARFNHPAVQKLLEYRAHEKTLSAFGENVLSLINPRTGRIHPDFNQHGADTGRFSCTRPNIQQIPATSDFRKCFIAADGYRLITCDYSQAELRILAELSGDEAFINAFKSGQDLHSLTASQMFGVPLESVTKPQRSAAKAINFGLAYGMGPGGLAPRLGVSLDEAKELIAKYFRAYPGIQKWLDRAAKDAVRNGYSLTPLGRKRFYTLPDESLKRTNEEEYRRQIASIERQGKNSPIQGANADMTKLALIYLRRILKDYDARTVNTVHDEIVVEVREDQAEEVRHIVEREMVRAGQAILKVVPVVAEATVADYWSK